MNTIFCDRDCPERNSHCHATCPEYTRKSKKHREDMEKAKLEKEIARLEKQARNEKQPKKKFELVQCINNLKQELSSLT